MRINSIGEFHGFMLSNGLTTIAPELAAFDVCMAEFNRLCNCDSATLRDSKLAQCRSHYMTFLSHVKDFKDLLLSKTSDTNIIFCINGQQVATLNR